MKTIRLIAVIIILFIPSGFAPLEFKTYRVILDPGHGGLSLKPRSLHGDRYDLLSGEYLDLYRSGAEYRELEERIIVYNIARKAEKILQQCAPGGDFSRFLKTLDRYSSKTPTRIQLVTALSRGESITEEKAEAMEDPNAAYRMFDYPSRKGAMKKGRISRINAKRPHLVLSLHCARAAPREYKGMNPVLAAPHSLLKKGLGYLRGEIKSKDFFYNSGYKDWFCESTRRSEFEWFLSDTSLYFTGYPLYRDHTIKLEEFRGYRHNMISWNYRDPPGWVSFARNHFPGTRYSRNYFDFRPSGEFWKREQSPYEEYRRHNGPEGFGGDNAYASYEIIRYILYSLHLSGRDNKKQVPGKGYVNIWIMPVHVNAINPFIELGYFVRKRDRYLLTKRQDDIAEGIAVAIYSLFTGLDVNGSDDFKYKPRGKRIDLEKYTVSGNKTYFDLVDSK